MDVHSDTLEFSTGGNDDVRDLTGEVRRCVEASGITAGTVTVFCPGRRDPSPLGCEMRGPARAARPGDS